jgi:ribonucleotide reductase beta subunit family protein with ferritin-like domain
MSNEDFISNYRTAEVTNTYVPCKENFFLKQKYYSACINHDSNVIKFQDLNDDSFKRHCLDWLNYFNKHDKSLVFGVANMLPHTNPSTFDKWSNIRSNITKEDEKDEEFLHADPERISMEPMYYPDIYAFRKRIEANVWHTEEVEHELSKDTKSVDLISEESRQYLQFIIGFFSVADLLVLSGIDEAVAPYVNVPEFEHYILAVSNQEAVHNEAYDLQLQGIASPDKIQEIREYVKTVPFIARIKDWVTWWSISEHCAADIFSMMACLEGVLFSGFFAAIQHYKTQNLFNGVTTINEYIVRDENVHTEFWCMVKNKLKHQPPDHVVQAICQETFNLCDDFFKQSIPSNLIGMNYNLMNQHVKSVGDHILYKLNTHIIYYIDSPFDFMRLLYQNQYSKTNFFEKNGTQYSIKAVDMEFKEPEKDEEFRKSIRDLVV